MSFGKDRERLIVPRGTLRIMDCRVFPKSQISLRVSVPDDSLAR
jgi:hypothetical protein